MTAGSGGRERAARPPVLSDVAALAGVSMMTVSRALNDPARVHPDTRARVLAAVRKLGYRPNSAARRLVTGRSGALGVVSFDTTLYGPASTLHAIEQAARRRDYVLNIASLDTLNRLSIEDAVDRLRAQSVDGVIVVAPHESAAEGLNHLPAELPVVAVDAGDSPSVPVVMVDQYGGAVRATRHLLSLGHETVWHITGPDDWVDARGRAEGWKAALEAAGRQAPEPLAGDWTARSGYRAGRRLAADPAVTAVFAANDQMALGLLRALREAGRRVPEDVSVVGFDDIPEAAYLWPPLTTVRQDFHEVGAQAVDLLLSRLAGAPAPGARTVEPELIVRESATPPRS
ncbi:LacI family DNA-binding transcriptional regulator [Bailinhaonella thermotolerans]|uniref:LacI family DNA-binding transcriptional regulator n=1 Tax=Bailinhaonella thermotolerans TaxID=1070861 RepID=A0A3A4AS66_9ACTN|nr:LacI family DNA-binding transcriptional regulator [Bailinhaonella thermotolerans]RJL32728.1 LacI family DNA-binding transcriptional regulator [Bailinhaonella thermotolerans]